MAQERAENFHVLVMDDYEGLAEGVPAFKRLKSRADVVVRRKRLETEEETKGVLKNVHAIVLVRGRSRFGEKEFILSPLRLDMVQKRYLDSNRYALHVLPFGKMPGL